MAVENVDQRDSMEFYDCWSAGDAIADLNADGAVDGADAQWFFERTRLGC